MERVRPESFHLGRLDVYPRHLLLPRAPVCSSLNDPFDSHRGENLVNSSQAQHQHLVRRHNRIAFPRPSGHSIYNQQRIMARRILGLHWSLSFMLAPRHRPDGRDNIQSWSCTRSATSAQVASAQTHRRRAMARAPSQTDFPPSLDAPCHRHLEASCPPVHHLLLPQFRLDHRRQRNHLNLAHHLLQIHPLQPRCVHSPPPFPSPASARII